MEKDRAVVLITDNGFLLPSLLVAKQVSQLTEVLAIADIFVFLVDIHDDIFDIIQKKYEKYSLKFRKLDSSLFLTSQLSYFNKTHISKTTLGRFALLEALPEGYKHITYLDGDLQILGDILPLIQFTVPVGKIAAANDYLWLCEGDRGAFWAKHREYLDNLGIRNPKDYFNAGVLAFHRDTWREMAPAALKYFYDHPRRCIYHDQSALNALFLGRREVISPAFNFNSFYAELGVADIARPNIVHFTGGNKPWHYSGPPWNGRFIAEYSRFADENNDISSYPASSTATRAQGGKLVKSIIKYGRQWFKRRRFKSYLFEEDFSI